MELEEVIKEIEEDQLFKRGITSKIFKSMLNQPSLVSVNSANAVKTESENGYYTFKIDFTRPILDVDTIQLLTTSIPQANASIPNTAITFWYYRLSQYTGTTPSLNNLYCVRLLPSYYKPEFISTPTDYGWNKTFSNYTSLSTELAKSCVKDVGYDNLELLREDNFQDYYYTNFPILPGDISIAYNSTYNKFQMTGNTTKLAYIEWSNATTYAEGAVVYRTVPGGLGLRTYTSLVGANLNNNPLISPTFWKRTYNEIVVEWSATTLYQEGDIVEYNGILYRAKQDTLNNLPTDTVYWENFTSISPAPIVYNYLITGYDDPNVVIRQGKSFQMPYNPNYFYRTSERVKTDGRVFEAITETSIFTPGNVDKDDDTKPIAYYRGTYRRRVANQPIQNWTVIQPNPTNLPIWSQYQPYQVGDLVYSGPRVYKCLIANTNAQPTANFTNGLWILQAQHPYDAVPYFDPGGAVYNAGDCATYNGQLWVANTTTNDVPAEPNWTSIGREVWLNYNWDGTDYGEGGVVYFNGKYYEQNDTTFNSIPPVPSWSSKTFYSANTLVQNAGLVFRCMVPNQGSVPADVTNTWSAGTIYEVGQIVGLNNKQYICKIKHLNLNPENPVPDWTNVSVYVPFNIAFVPGVQSYRCTNPVGPSALSPNNDVANWQGVFGGNDISNVWGLTGDWEELDDSNWNPTTLGGEVSGLYGLSSQYDYVEQYQNTELVNFPTGIGGQPFNISPERLLNSILGFTWNGVFDPTQLTNLPTNEVSITISGGAVSLYNRMRPVPTYDVIQVNNEQLRAAASTVTRTYTAEGYANLVYSSIVNIYTNIIGGSTLDTVRNTNLVATTSMNCGNLGIAFHGNYIDTPLQRVAGDINELTIELRDEVGEPFFLTNNAIMTATFKVTYKDGSVRIEEPA
jgi:hypothetical protein